jgi:hypothetical protein
MKETIIHVETGIDAETLAAVVLLPFIWVAAILDAIKARQFITKHT